MTTSALPTRAQIEAQEKKFYKDYYSQLEGATILKFKGMKTETGMFGRAFPQFIVKLANGEEVMIEVSQDEEGNGGGFLFGLKA
jgi:hypothetical protein